jgi:hypothetical protein
MKTLRIILAKNKKVATKLQTTIAIETEWGEECYNGSRLTLNHHGVNSNNPAPCMAEVTIECGDNDIVTVSHFDLDTLGGILNVSGSKLHSEYIDFWRLVEYIDVYGMHKLNAYEPLTEVNKRILYAFHAWNTTNRLPRLTDDYMDISDYVCEAITILGKIFNGDKELIENGILLKTTKKNLISKVIYNTKIKLY